VRVGQAMWCARVDLERRVLHLHRGSLSLVVVVLIVCLPVQVESLF
jgi:hypothetical protein